ncbi:MAG: hypothetical protein WCS32_02780, partial [Candidatus Izemoplasmatales bacterium]
MERYLRLIISIIIISIGLYSLNLSDLSTVTAFEHINQQEENIQPFSDGKEIVKLSQIVSRTSETTITYGGTGSQSDPYIISTANDMISLSALVAGGNDFSGTYFKVVSSSSTISLGNFIPIGSAANPFRGHFDGGFVTFDLAISRTTTNNQGLFGYLDSGSIKNLSVSGSVVGDVYTGAVVGYQNSGTIENVYNLAYV